MKKALIGIAVLLVVVGAGLLYLWGNLDRLVKDAIQTYGSEATGTAVRVDSVKLELKDGRATIQGLRVANPPGFSDPDIFRLDMISARVDIATLNQTPLVIDEIVIRTPSVVYEIDRSGNSNVDVLKRRLGAGDRQAGDRAAPRDQPRFIIRRLVIEGTSATVRIAALDQAQSVTLPGLVLTDIGRKHGGATADEIAREVSARMLGNLQGAVAKQGLTRYLGTPADEIQARMEKQLGHPADQVGNALKGLFGR